MNWLAIDTNALMDAFNEPKLLNAFIAKVNRCNITVCIPHTALEETFDKNKYSAGWKMLSTDLDDEIRISRFLHGIMQEEVQHQVERQPTISPKLARKVIEFLSNGVVPNSSTSFKKIKDDMLDLDATLTEESLKHSVEEVATILKSYISPRENNFVLELLYKRRFPDLPPAKVISNPRRYRTFYTFAAAEEFYAFGLMLNKETKGKINDPIVVKTGKDRGTHHDNIILAECSYCDFIVTNDNNFRVRTQRLIDRGVIQIKVLTLDDFLNYKF